MTQVEKFAVPTCRLACHDSAAAQRLAGLVERRGYVAVHTDGCHFALSWGGPIYALFEIGGWARDCGWAGDVEVSEFYMQAAG